MDFLINDLNHALYTTPPPPALTLNDVHSFKKQLFFFSVQIISCLKKSFIIRSSYVFFDLHRFLFHSPKNMFFHRIHLFVCFSRNQSNSELAKSSSYIFSTYIGFFFIHQKTCFFIEFICLFFSRNQSNSELAKKCYYTQKDNQT